MSKRKELAKLNSLIESHNSEIDIKVNELADFQNKKNDLIIQIINDEKLLKNSQWELKTGSLTSLKYSGKSDDIIMSHITNLISQDSFCWIDIEPGIQLQIDGDDVEITFDQPKTILSFIKKNQMSISGASVSDKIQALKRETAALEQLTHIFSIKN